MPKKRTRDNPKGRELRTVHTAGSAAQALLQRITRNAQVVLPGGSGAASAGDWGARLRPLLPERERPHLLSVLEKTGELVLMVDSAAWAGRIRLALPELVGATGDRKLTVRIDPQTRKKPV
jgi:hypothetical protein